MRLTGGKRFTVSDRIFNVFNVLVMILLAIVTLYPFWYCIILSFNEGLDALKGPLGLIPRKFTLDNYNFVFSNKQIVSALFMSIARTAVGSVASTVFTGIVAYGLSKKFIMGRKIYMRIFVFTMYFGGGMIPTYLLIKNLGLIDNFLVYILPGLFTFYHCILFMSYFDSIPSSLEEAAALDGAGKLRTLFQVILPVSKPIFATVCLYEAVGQWNSWFDTLIYTRSDYLMTLQGIMAKLLQQTQALQQMMQKMSNSGGAINAFATIQPTTVRVATMVVTVFPIVVIYPFFQKYFVKGITLGSVKG